MGKFCATISSTMFMAALAALALAPATTESQAAEPNFKGKTQTVKVSASRTEVPRKGDYISRKKLKVGMVCEFIYPGNKKVAKSITCD